MPFTVQLTFANGSTARVVQVEQSDEPLTVVERAHLPVSQRPVIVLIGGADEMTARDFASLRSLFNEVIAPISEETEAIVVDGGTDAGIMRLMGEARAAIQGTFLLVGVCPIELVRPSSLPFQFTPSSAVAKSAQVSLEPHHTHLLLVPGHEWGAESEKLAQIATALAGQQPSVTILVNGGKVSLLDAQENIQEGEGRPLAVIGGTGRLADKISEAIRHPDSRLDELTCILSYKHLHLHDLSNRSRLLNFLRQHLLGGKS